MITRGWSAIQPFLCTDPGKYQDWKQLHNQRQMKSTHFRWPLQCQKNHGGQSSALDSRANFKSHLTLQHKRAKLLQESGLQNCLDSDDTDVPMEEPVITSSKSTRVTKLKGGTQCHHLLSSRLRGAANAHIKRQLESNMNVPVHERLVTPHSTPRASKVATHCHHLSASRLCSAPKSRTSQRLDSDIDVLQGSSALSPSTRTSRITSPSEHVSKGAGHCHHLTASRLCGAAKSRIRERLDIHKDESKVPSSPSTGVSKGSCHCHHLSASRLCSAAKSRISRCLDSDITDVPEGSSASSPSTRTVSRKLSSPHTRISRIINSPSARVATRASHCHHLATPRLCGAAKSQISPRLDSNKDVKNLISSVSKYGTSHYHQPSASRLCSAGKCSISR